jgi:uncharacterized membrane protein
MSKILKTLPYGLLVFLSLGVTAYAIVTYALLPLGVAVHPVMRSTFEAQRLAIYAHIFASAVALALGPPQFWLRLRTKRPSLHRFTGRLYLGIGVALGGVAGLYMAFHAFGGTITQVGFACMAVLWLYTGLRAYVAIRAGDVVAHRRWMIRNFSLTFAAVTLRLWLPSSMLLGFPFEVAYPAIAWLCWLPNLLVAELLVRRATAPYANAPVLRDA